MSDYKQLATKWFPDSKDNALFLVIVAATLFIILAIAIVISLIDVPEQQRSTKRVIPERVAKFIDQRKKPEPPPKPKVKEKPKPPPPPKPKVARKKPLEQNKKPLTQQEQKARDKAKNSGLLSLASELNDLIDTTSIDKSITTNVRKVGVQAKTQANTNENLLSQGVGQGSGGVAQNSVGQTISVATLSTEELTLIDSGLGKRDRTEADNKKPTQTTRGAKVRSEEEISLVFDQNKAKLYRVYNRARQKNFALKGKLIIELTISPEGNVTSARIVSSELSDKTLERKILARIKGFKFKNKDVEPITVTFPIEFVPS